MSVELGVSSTPIKDALFRLSGEGLVEISSRSGTYVRSITQKDIHEILQVRMFLEREAVKVIAEMITDAQLEELGSIYQECLLLKVKPKDAESYRVFMECDSRFHGFLIQVIGNKFLENAYKNLNSHMQTVRFLMVNHVQGKLRTTDNDHQMIISALKKRDGEAAQSAITNHFHNVDTAWKKVGKARKEDQVGKERK